MKKQKLRVDAHQHFWRYLAEEYPWMSEDMRILKKDHLPPMIADSLERRSFEGAIAIQARHDIRENDLLLGLAAESERIKGVVGWVDLAGRPEEELEKLAANPIFRGIRHVLADAPETMKNSAFISGLAILASSGKVFDLLVLPNQLRAAESMIRSVPGIRIAINHAGKPILKSEELGLWQDGMKRLSEIDNVYCKLSGLPSEAPGGDWTGTDYRPWVDTLLDLFGTKRLMFGSNWPTCTPVGASFDDIVDLTEKLVQKLSPSEQEEIFGSTARRCYRL